MFEPVEAPEAAPEPVVLRAAVERTDAGFLRLEFLWNQALFHCSTPNPWASRAAVGSLLEILAVTARGDPRGDVLKELERQMHSLRDYQNRPGVDGARLRAVLATLVRRREELNAAGSNFIQPLRDSEFLNAIKHRSAIPGGTCEFDLPDYFHWLNRPAAVREHDLEEWMGRLRALCESVSELLWVTRENARPKKEIAQGGVFQIVFEREHPVQLLRIELPGGLGVVSRGQRQSLSMQRALHALGRGTGATSAAAGRNPLHPDLLQLSRWPPRSSSVQAVGAALSGACQ